MKRYFFGSAAAILCAGSLVAAQAPAGTSQQTPSQPQGGAQSEPQSQTRTTAQAGAGATTTLTGCVYREQDVPGRSPNVAERAGILEDYILADVRMSPAGSSGATGTSGAGAAAPGAVGAGGAASGGAAATSGSASASGTMYKLEFVDDDKLQALVGKRVEVTGRIDREAGDSGARPQGTTGAAGGAAAGQAGATADRPGSTAGQTSTTAQADRSAGPDSIELPEFEVTSIREMAGTCAATPAGR